MLLFLVYNHSIIPAGFSRKNLTVVTLSPGICLTSTIGDITQLQKCDSIVNAANQWLQSGGGVCGAIFEAAGYDCLTKACAAALNNLPNNTCNTGSAVITSSCNLATQGIKYIIHAVGPIYDPTLSHSSQCNLLAQTYQSALTLAQHQSLVSIAFPFISAGIYSFPKDMAAACALHGILTFVKNNSNTTIRNIYLELFSQDDYDAFMYFIIRKNKINTDKINAVITQN